MMQVRSIAGDTVGTLLFRHLGRDDDEAEAAFYAVNTGVAKYGPVLPSGVVVNIPDIAPPPLQTVVSVWD
jgi:phage tail protein X